MVSGGGSPTYSHGRGLPWLQLNAGRQGISYGGAEAQRANDHWPGLTLLPMILLLFFGWGSVPHFHISSSQRGRLSPHWVLASCGRIWFAGDGAFAPEAWVGSAIQPYPFFLIRADLRDSRACSKTAEDCRGYNAPPSCLRASVRNPCFFYTTAASSFSWLRVRAPGLLGRFGITENRLDW